MPRLRPRTGAIFAVVLVVLGAARGGDPKKEDRAFFESKVRPVLEKNCLLCHGGAKVRNGLEVTSRPSLLRGGDHGPAIVPGDPDRSLMIRAVRYTGNFHMPPKGKLDDQQIADLAEWVRRGAPWPSSR
jgi:mono/diheme cytochrome c family protein